jgi:F-type H+-transporting ATPase subunit a
MKRVLYILLLILGYAAGASAAEGNAEPKDSQLNVKDIIMGHIGDAYEWHIAGNAVIPLPCILYSSDKGLDVFMSNRLEGGESYNGYHIDQASGKIVNEAGVRPFDISITKNVLQLFIVCILLCSVILSLAAWYKRNGYDKAPGGFVGMMEAVIDFLDQDVAKANIGHGYEKFSPYLGTIFFLILTCNLLGLIPIFPGGANLTGNIAVTMTLAIASWIAINFFAPKAYFKSIFWPEVPVFLKAPLPIMPAIEFIGVFTKPFSLTIRLFANIFAGHAIILSLTCIIFVAWQSGAVLGLPMTILSVLFSIFMNCLELLVAFVQAYVFTLLTASFIGLAQNE